METPPYTAPAVVYTSARVVAPVGDTNVGMEWIFPVDSGFYYLLRLHFCEFTLDVRAVNERVFTVNINYKTMEFEADVISWAGGPDIPIFRDYVTWVPDDGRRGMKDLRLSLFLYLEGNPKYYSESPINMEPTPPNLFGAAKGLHYLHNGTEHVVIHRDIKSTNILLDENRVAKISDFGLSKMGQTNDSFTHISTNVKGTFGYLDPKYLSTHQLTRKSDVYSFGVVLCEVLSGRAAVDTRLDEEQHSLAGWARYCIREGEVDRLIDHSLMGQISAACFKVFVGIAGRCIHTKPLERPTMADVVMGLELSLALQQTATDSAELVEDESLDEFIREDNPSSSTRMSQSD